MEKRENKSVAPFLRSKETTAVIMRDVVTALIPAVVIEAFFGGFPAFLVMLLSVTSCVLTEHICKRVRKTCYGGYECSAVVTGLLLGLMLSKDVPYWIPVAGGVFAILVVKMLFGGLGRNLFNPAAAAAGVLFWFFEGPTEKGSVFLLLLGAVYLLLCKVISLRVPVAYVLSFGAVLLVIGEGGVDVLWLMEQICTGSVVLGAFFMATDYTTSPMTKWGKVWFGLAAGALTGVFRVLGFGEDAVVFAILCGNILTPLLDRITFPRSFGKGKKVKN